jgi:hypothetical protein
MTTPTTPTPATTDTTTATMHWPLQLDSLLRGAVVFVSVVLMGTTTKLRTGARDHQCLVAYDRV